MDLGEASQVIAPMLVETPQSDVAGETGHDRRRGCRFKTIDLLRDATSDLDSGAVAIHDLVSLDEDGVALSSDRAVEVPGVTVAVASDDFGDPLRLVDDGSERGCSSRGPRRRIFSSRWSGALACTSSSAVVTKVSIAAESLPA